MLNSSSWFLNNPTFYNDVATQSVRLDDGSSAYLTFTPSSASSATDRRKVTHSVWVKRGALGTGTTIYSGNRSGGGDYYQWRFSSDDKLTLILDVDAGGYGYDTSAVFRDVGAWYHVCVIIDTTQATNTDRVKIYVNGVLQDKTTKYAGGHVPQNFSTYVMDGNEDEIGRFAFTDASYFDGYMSEFITTIGQDNTISEFGELKNGVWIPINYEGSYGGNGFRLQFNQTGTGTASSSTIGADTSGNANHWTSSGIVASDCDMSDSPENNFCTLNINARGTTNVSLSEGNLKFVKSGANFGNVLSTMPLFSGKWYFEGVCLNNNLAQIGVQEITNNIYQNSGNFGANTDLGMWDSRGFFYDEGTAGGTPPSYTTGDIIGIAFDVEAGKIWFAKNGTYLFSGDPANGTNQSTGSTNNLSSIGVTPAGNGEDGGGHTLNFGQDSSFAGAKTAQGNTDENGYGDFYYSPPSGYLALCSVNLPEPTISPNSATQANDYFNTVTWTGTGSAISISGVGFQPDFVWGKNRAETWNHYLFDSVRGTNKLLQSNLTNAETTNDVWGYVSSFNSDGFSLSAGSSGINQVNDINDPYVAWNWKTNGGTIATNTAGTITSSVSANTDAGFSVVGYTGTDSATETIGHGLGAVPAMLIIKSRDSALNWAVYHKGSDATAPEDYLLRLNTNDARVDVTSAWNDTAPTSSVFTVGTSSLVNNTDNFIAYCFAEIEGYSRFSSFIGNGSTDGTFVYTGFRPAWVMMKNTVTAGNSWVIQDAVRSTYNVVNAYLLANDSGAEGTGVPLDILSNGFKMKSASQNDSGANFIYMAFAENPFKYSTAR